jgi:hypothetical protein
LEAGPLTGGRGAGLRPAGDPTLAFAQREIRRRLRPASDLMPDGRLRRVLASDRSSGERDRAGNRRVGRSSVLSLAQGVVAARHGLAPGMSSRAGKGVRCSGPIQPRPGHQSRVGGASRRSRPRPPAPRAH